MYLFINGVVAVAVLVVVVASAFFVFGSDPNFVSLLNIYQPIDHPYQSDPASLQ